MKITVKETKVICSNPTNPYHGYFAWPTVTRLQDGRLAMVASGFRKRHVCPFGKVVLCYSDDEGQTWTRPSIIMDTPLDDRDAGILPFGENSVIVTSFNNSKEMQREWNKESNNPHINGYLDVLDGDKAEEKYLGSTMIISHDGTKTFGDVMRVPVTAPHGPTLMNDGSILYVGRTFSIPKTAKDTDCIEAYKVYPDGTYEKLGEIENIDPEILSCEPHAIVLENGKIIVHIRMERSGYFSTYQSESYDDGKTFTKPHALLEKRGGAPAHLLELSDGTLISAYGYRNEPYGIKVMVSHDNGETWDTGHDIYVNGVSGDLGYPASVELANGDILTVFYAKETIDSPAVIMQTIWHMDMDAN